jgi:glycosyltransferase involved in cell wall biosynthesis
MLTKISIITICYGAAHLIRKTIESVAEQTYESIEYIIVDGDSPDNTREIVRSYGSKIHKFICEPDRGLYDAMNKGIRNSTGDLIIFLNAGDYYISSRVIEYLINKLNYEKADVFFGRYIWEDPGTKDIFLSNHDFTLFDWDLKYSNFPHPATLYKKEVLVKLGLFDENYQIMADYEWNVRALVKHRIPFQYLDIITVKFTADGISNNPENKKIIEMETDRISSQFYTPKWIFDFMDKYSEKNGILTNFIKKVIGKVYKKRLRKIY